MKSAKTFCGAALTAAAIFTSVLAPAADAKSHPQLSLIDKATCTKITQLANEGKPVPDVSILHDEESLPGYFRDGVLKYKVEDNFPYRKQLDAAVADWNNSLEGKASLKEVSGDEVDDDTVKIQYRPEPGGFVQGSAIPSQKRLVIKTATLMYPEALQGTIAHELGHLMGAGHSCDGALMAGANQKNISYHVTPLDVAAIVQGQFD